MGTGIAEVLARSGSTVTIIDVDDNALAASKARLLASTGRALERAKLTETQVHELRDRVSWHTDLATLSGCGLVIEAVTEREEAKVSLFERLASVVAADAVVATNTSALSVTRLATCMPHPQRFLGLHFFNPAPVRRLVEVISGQLTDPDVFTSVARYLRQDVGAEVIMAQDRPGFVVNALLTPYLLSAIRMLEAGHAMAEEIDLGMVQGCAHPIGPLRLADMVGLDTLRSAAESMYAALHEPQYAPPPLLVRMVDAGLHGVKTGRGFYGYGDDAA